MIFNTKQLCVNICDRRGNSTWINLWFSWQCYLDYLSNSAWPWDWGVLMLTVVVVRLGGSLTTDCRFGMPCTAWTTTTFLFFPIFPSASLFCWRILNLYAVVNLLWGTYISTQTLLWCTFILSQTLSVVYIQLRRCCGDTYIHFNSMLLRVFVIQN